MYFMVWDAHVHGHWLDCLWLDCLLLILEKKKSGLNWVDPVCTRAISSFVGSINGLTNFDQIPLLG